MEVLVTLLVLAIGLLGIAGMQASALKSSHDASLRTQALQLANDMADRMRANKAGITAGSYSNINTADNDYTAPAGCTAAGCTAANMAIYDASVWEALLSQELPSGNGTVVANGSLFTITIQWDEYRNGGNACGTDPAVNLKCFTLEPRL